MRFNIFLIMSLLFFFEVEAQNNMTLPKTGFHLEVTIPTQKNQVLYLGQYWKDKSYAIDSVLLSGEGKGSFNNTERLPEGQYFLHIKPSFQADFLVGSNEQDIMMYLNEHAFSENKVTGSIDTELLWEYLAKIENFNKEITSLEISYTDTTSSEGKRTQLLQEIKQWEDKRNEFEAVFKKENKNTWAGKLITGLNPVELPYPQPKDQQEFLKNKKYGKEHYFDNIDLTDPRFWRTNYLNSRIDIYMKEWIDPTPDSLAVAASRLVAKTKSNDFCFKEMLSKLFNESSSSHRMGDENIWARLYEDYIKDNNISWINESQYTQLNSKYDLIRNNRIGMTAKDMMLQTIDSTQINTNKLLSEYLLLYFYDTGCGHCEIETPKLHSEYNSLKARGLEIVAIYIGSDKEEWKKFVDRHKLTDWINAADLDYKSQHWLNYDLSGVPMIYLLDKNKEIIAKAISKEQITTILDFYSEDKNGIN